MSLLAPGIEMAEEMGQLPWLTAVVEFMVGGLFMGQASGMVEPVAGVIGAAFVLNMQGILPYALCFAAGAMIFVVVEELIPESQRIEAHIDLVTPATMAGFSVMMLLDVALG